ncbi:hypothetical protein GCM10019059_34730 [Camelimonas fluminis]|uniref:Uncharacterized protein n=1 Tax=Camelimonas fluminis TaxID=1576911 RepID=A0ABV7UFT2_9HYPH|nr:hypothetical protein [Camelimonas fluminis]GHE72180.1 hypothetical protein GCM10019059_34730 [Camelimonas fluminis]
MSSDFDGQTVLQVEAPIDNFYGTPTLSVNEAGSFVLQLDDYSGTKEVVVSNAFAFAWIHEFGDEGRIAAHATGAKP